MDPDPTRMYSTRVAANTRQLRRWRRWSAQDLADHLHDIGCPLTRNVIANRELGRHGASPVTVDELVALATVFDMDITDLLAATVEPPPCPHCSNQPPAGFSCLTCHRTGPTDPTKNAEPTPPTHHAP